MPVKLDAKMSRKAAVITGNVSDKRGTSHAYVVFQDETAAIAALASNMHMVSLEKLIEPASCKIHRLYLLEKSLHEYSQHQPDMQYQTIPVSANLSIASLHYTQQNAHSKQSYSILIMNSA